MKKILYIISTLLVSSFFISCKSDQEKAQELYLQAIAADSAKNYSESIRLYEESGKLGKVEAYLRLGNIYRDTLSEFTDTLKAVAYYQKGDSLGSLEAASELGALCYRGYADVKSDTAKALKYIKKAGDKITANGNYAMFLYYCTDSHFDEKKSREYVEKALSQGHPRAYGALADIYDAEEQYDKALELLKKGVELKASNSIVQYGSILSSAERASNYHIEPDGELAISLLKSVINEYPEKGTNIGYIYYMGNGVEKDLAKAAYWFKIGAEANNPEGMFDYGLILLNGEGVNRDKTEARKWFEKSAKLGNKEAKRVLNKLWRYL